MPTSIPIRERIVRQMLKNLSTATCCIYRADARGEYSGMHDGDLEVIVGDETTLEEGAGETKKRLLVHVYAILLLAENGGAGPSHDFWLNYRKSLLINAALGTTVARVYLPEAVTGYNLADLLRVYESPDASTADGRLLAEATVTFEVHYWHNYGDPFAYSTRVPLLSEATISTWSWPRPWVNGAAP